MLGIPWQPEMEVVRCRWIGLPVGSGNAYASAQTPDRKRLINVPERTKRCCLRVDLPRLLGGMIESCRKSNGSFSRLATFTRDIGMTRQIILAALLIPVVGFAQPPQPPHTILDSTDFAPVLSTTPIEGPAIPRQICAPSIHPQPVARGAADADTISLNRPGIGKASLDDTVSHVNCETVFEAGPPVGYRVTYDYLGRRTTVDLSYPPGNYLKIRKIVTVE
jgi:uncharacterized protein YcfJ